MLYENREAASPLCPSSGSSTIFFFPGVVFPRSWGLSSVGDGYFPFSSAIGRKPLSLSCVQFFEYKKPLLRGLLLFSLLIASFLRRVILMVFSYRRALSGTLISIVRERLGALSKSCEEISHFVHHRIKFLRVLFSC